MDIHVWQLVVISVLLLLSGVGKAIQDKLQFHFDKSIFKNAGNWWNPKTSWKNKYEWFPKSKFLTWVFSNTLVSLTDAWHFFGFFRDFAIFACMPIASGNYWLFLGYPVYRAVFHVFFTWIFKKD